MFALSLAGLVIGGAVVLLTPQIVRWLPEFLETNVFHRTFDHAAYFESIVSLISFPIFFGSSKECVDLGVHCVCIFCHGVCDVSLRRNPF